MPEPVLPIQTIRYKTYIKEALVEALRASWATHPDTFLQNTSIGLDSPMTEADYPHVVVRFYGRSVRNAGVAHHEWLPIPDSNPERYHKYKHYFYNGDIEFSVYALSSLDRDLIADSIVQTLTMGDLEAYTNAFLNRIYDPNPLTDPAAINHVINLNTDEVQEFGETEQPAPWLPEDVLIYQTAHRIAVFGQFYSRTPTAGDYGVVERVDQFPYIDGPELQSAPVTLVGTTPVTIPVPDYTTFIEVESVRNAADATVYTTTDYAVVDDTIARTVASTIPDGATVNLIYYIDPKPFPPWPGPDGEYGTGDDQADPALWEGDE